LLSDLLLALGLIGAIFFLLFQIVAIWTIARQWASPEAGPFLKELALFLLILYSYNLAYALIAGPIDALPQFLLACFFYFRGNQQEQLQKAPPVLDHPWPV